MSVRRLSPAAEAGLRDADLTYRETGHTLGPLPTGYRTIHRSREISANSYETVAEDLMRWRIHERAGLQVRASGDVTADAVVVLRFGLGPAGVQAPCRVVYTIDEAQRCGFAYGTLPGHPESGEEAFIIERSPAGVVTFTIRAFSRPASALTRFAGPAGHLVQALITNRYLRATER